jgi:hypothetical protein
VRDDALVTQNNSLTPSRGIYNEVIAVEETETYRFILEEGAVKYAHHLILEQGRMKCGEPDQKQKDTLFAIEDLERLTRMALAVLTAKDWDALLRVQ